MNCKCETPKKNYYSYYDTPDGCDIDKKAMVATRYGIIAGMVAGTYDVLLYSHASGFGPILGRYASHIIPLGLMGGTFALVSNGLLLAREKDDKLNYFIGGFVCSPILAHYVKSPHALVAGGVVLGLIAVVKKEAIQRCGRFIPDPFPNRRMINTWRHDWTLTQDPRDVSIKKCADQDTCPPPPPVTCEKPKEDRCEVK